MGEFEELIEKIYEDYQGWEGDSLQWGMEEFKKIIAKAEQEFPKCETCDWFDSKGCFLHTPNTLDCPKNKWFVKWFK